MTTLESTVDRVVDVASRYDPVIGLETHVELGTVSKMFCGCPTTFGAEPNTQVCPVCLGLPGSLPVPNEVAIESTIRIGLALHCDIASWCRFARKNYFYPDMPKNFQISQYDEPLCTDGYLDVTVDGRTVRVEIERVHLEEDTGKSLHVGGATGRIHGADHSLVDYNRAGIPLVEIVTRPVSGTGALAPEVGRAYVTELRELLRSPRRQRRADGAGLAALRRQRLALAGRLRGLGHPQRDEERQLAALGRAGDPVRDEPAGRPARPRWPGGPGDQALPRGQRPDHAGAEQGGGHRLPLLPRARPGPGGARTPAWVDRLRTTLPELPAERRARLASELGATDFEMASMANAGVVELVAATAAAGAPAAEARNWWLGYLTQKANAAEIEPADLAISPAQVARVVALVEDGTLSVGLARQAVDGVLETGADVDTVVAERGLRRVSDVDALAAAVDEAIAAQPDVAEKIRGGKVAAAGALVGAVMKATRGQADAKTVRELILQKLS